jgi:MoaA/NifB/PqqE/SkfB family radical SAM enzyme
MRKVDLIWNMTLVCPWDCKNCCVDAIHVTKRDGHIKLRSHALTKVEQVPHQTENGSPFDQAMALRQRQGLELDFAGKLRVIDHLDGFLPKIDFSGGDPLSATENLEVMQIATQRFGRQQITLTATGAGLAKCVPEEIAPLIGELNFTYDSVTPKGNAHRPGGYANGNLRKAAQFVHAGVRVRGSFC